MILKKFSFWLTLFGVLVCLFNATGMDDKNLLLFFTSPHLMFTLEYTSILRHFDGMLEIYAINIVGWFLIGLLIDFIISAFKRK